MQNARWTLSLLIAVSPAAPAAPAVRYRGITWREAMVQAASDSGLPCLFDENLPQEVLNRPIRFESAYLSPPQVLRWLARLPGAAVIRVHDRYLIGRPEAWPGAWQAVWASSGRGDEPQGLFSRDTADLAWVDYPLGAAVAEIRRLWRVDVIVEPAVLARQDLLNLSRRGIECREALLSIATQCGGEWAAFDGAVAIGRRPWITSIAPPPRTATSSKPTQHGPAGRATASRPVPAWWAAWVELDGKETSWKMLLWPMMQQVTGEAVAWPITGGSHPPPGTCGTGTVGHLLEGMRLLGCLRWEWIDGAGAGRLEVRAE